jgi:phosphomethylpyrimidine synthase
MVWAIRWGADTVMDLSTGKNIHETREWIIRNSSGPDRHSADLPGARKGRMARQRKLTWEIFRDTLIEQCRARASTTSPFTPACSCDYVPLTANRMTGIVSRGGSIMAQVVSGASSRRASCTPTSRKSATIMKRKYDVAFSLGDGLRPGSIYDANDEAQLGELKHSWRADRSRLATRCAGDDRGARAMCRCK